MVDSSLLTYIRNNGIEHYFDKDASDLVSFKIGGCAELVVYPKTVQQLCEILVRLRSYKKVVLGFGTNCYFSDGKYCGVVIVTRYISEARAIDCRIFAECGAAVSKLCKFAQENTLSGLEFAYGIPGSIGGAVAMNASAFGTEFSGLVSSGVIFDAEKEEIREISYDEHKFALKSSVFKKRNFYLLKSELCLKKGEKDDILLSMSKNLNKRKATQPLELPSAGSTFVRPASGYASRMIDMCGLKGLRIGGAEVSTKHAGFIVNVGGATAHDVSVLIEIIKKKVFEKFNVELKEEIILIE